MVVGLFQVSSFRFCFAQFASLVSSFASHSSLRSCQVLLRTVASLVSGFVKGNNLGTEVH